MRRSLFIVLCALIVPPLFAKSLHWRAFDVTARLDADGRLHVREQQAIVFDGDWNGGERKFNVRPGQSLDVVRVVRVENGQDIPMAHGDLSQVDHWDNLGANTIRWRSRRASDPAFQNQEITYAIDYVLSGILQKTDHGARLNHDFAFPDRDGIIENFSLRLDLNPIWHGLPNPYVIQQRSIPSGAGVVVDSPLTYTGPGTPAAVRSTITSSHAAMIAGLLLIAGAFVTWKFYIDEAHKGRFGALFPAAAINQRWLERYVFSLPPEAVGYAWDEVTAAPEVGAVLARMEQEKKITTWVKQEPQLIGHKSVLHLKLDVDWKTLPPDEQNLVQSLFLGKIETDTDRIREHYKNTGFQPQKLIKPMIDEALVRVPEWNQPAAPVRFGEVMTFLATIVATAVALTVGKPHGWTLSIGSILTAAGIATAISARRAVDAGPWTPMFFAWGVMIAAVAGVFSAVSAAITDFAAATLAVAGVLIAACLLLISRSREAIPKVEFRRRLAAARKYFEAQLRSKNPQLQDAWYPYLIALGLGPDVDRWFNDFARAGAISTVGGSHSSSFGSSSSPTSSWTGGGGAFGGAGASGSWAAMSAIASGVATPGSSGGGSGGGGGGGGGSGGGGGGGW